MRATELRKGDRFGSVTRVTVNPDGVVSSRVISSWVARAGTAAPVETELPSLPPLPADAVAVPHERLDGPPVLGAGWTVSLEPPTGPLHGISPVRWTGWRGRYRLGVAEFVPTEEWEIRWIRLWDASQHLHTEREYAEPYRAPGGKKLVVFVNARAR